MFRQDCTCPALLMSIPLTVAYGAVTLFGPPFLTVPLMIGMALAWSAFARRYSRSLVDVLSSGY
jgi:predicted Kef-type K+ transport protein